MWFNIIPGAAVIVLALGLPGYGLWGMHYLVNGNHFRRSVNERWERRAYQRDRRITGDPYKVAGLESLD